MSDAAGSATGAATRWLATISAAVTVVLTVLNAYWSNQISRLEAELQNRQLQLEAERDRLARYTFVQGLFDDVLNEGPGQKTLTVNLINLALNEQEARQLFAGLEAAASPEAREVGTLGSDAVALAGLVAKMNDAVRENRLGAVEELIQQHRGNSQAVDLALSLLEPPKLGSLSSSGRINVLVYLRNTDAEAWSPEFQRRARQAIGMMRERAERGAAAIGSQTEEALTRLTAHLDSLDAGR